MLRDLDSLHAGTETHGCVSLGDTTSHTTSDATAEVVCTKSFGIVFGFGRNEKENGTLRGSLNPGPGNETLVVYSDITESVGEILQRRIWERWIFNDARKGRDQQPRAPPRPQIRAMAPAKLSCRLAAMVVLITSSGYHRIFVSRSFPVPSFYGLRITCPSEVTL